MRSYRKLANIFLLFVMVAGLTSYMFIGKALAVGLLTSRSIQMSSAVPSATKVQYIIKFTVATTHTIGGIIVEFCDSDPIPGDACTAVSGFSTSFGTNLTNGNITVSGVGSGWSCDANCSSHLTMFYLTNATPQAATAGSTAVTITAGDGSASGLSNPTTTAPHSFYARILTFDTQANADAYAQPTLGTGLQDDGGIALTTTQTLLVTSKVEEQITFCVYTGGSCGTGNQSITLGDATTGLLSTTLAFINTSAKFQANTNATNGMDIYSAGTTLTSPQSNTIAAIGGPTNPGGGTGLGAPYSSVVGSEQFGFCITTTTGTGQTVTAAAPYNDSNCSSASAPNTVGTAKFAFDTTTAGTNGNLTSLGGMKIAGSTGPSATTTGTFVFLGNIANTTKSGVYTETQSFVAVGKY